MSRKLVKSIAVLAAAAALTSSAATGVASAAPSKPAGSKAQGAKKPGKKPARRAEGRGGRVPGGFGGKGGGQVRYAKVTGTSTGNGPATAGQCAEIAANLETAWMAADDYMLEGMSDEADGMLDAIDEMTSNGTKAGCKFQTKF